MNIQINKEYLFMRKKDLRVYILTSKFIYPKEIPKDRRIEIQNCIETRKDGVKEISVKEFNKLGLFLVGVI